MKKTVAKEIKNLKSEKNIRPAKRVQKCLEYVREMQTYLDYYTGLHKDFRSETKAKVEYVIETLVELGADQKEHDARLAKKLKGLWRNNEKK